MRCKGHALGHCVRSSVPFDFRRNRTFPSRSLASLFISAFVGAFVSAKKCGSGGLRAGLFSGVLFLLVIALVALGAGTSIRPLMFAICAAVILVTSAFAGISGAARKPKKRRKF